ncbi:PAS domain-containing sensor histidine kinase [Sphingobacterium multivorum]|uniref:PAS domain-containing sensor histidine kinase n=1 Tax=Sphingobacterium multivorum TaxID=28454 RepID=UPI0028B0EC2E|nr:HAMP domain-containing sensor histidine kinase [Sphingobacterium multivorum]
MKKKILHDLKFLEKVLNMTCDTLLLVNKDNICVDAIMKTNNPVLNSNIDPIGENLLSILPQPTSALIEQEFNFCRHTGETSNVNYDLPTDEQMYYFKFVIHKFDEEHLLCQYRDITQRSNMKYRLKSALTAQLEVGKVAMIGHWTYDLQRQELIHNGYSNLHKRNLEAPEKITLAELLTYVHPDDRKGMEAFLHNDSIENNTFEYRIKQSDVPITYVRATKYAKRLENNVCIIEGFSQNVSDFIKNRNELEMVLAVVDNAPYSIFACHKNGNMAFANKACRKQNGLNEQEDITDLKIFECLREFTTQEAWDLSVQKIISASGYYQYRCDTLYPELDIIGSECSSLMVKNGNGEDIVWTIKRDISDQLRYEEQLLRSKEAAEESERLKSAFISNMNHEIRTPLSAIMGFGSIIADTPDPELRKEYGELLNANSSQLLRLITDVLEMSQMDAGKVRLKNSDVSLKGILNELSLSFLPNDEQPAIIFDIPERDLVVWLDRGRVIQVLVNLINNSLKFTPPDGIIHVGYRVREDHIEFYVKDNGIGIAKEKQDSIFKRFYKINALDKGTGLGLAICKGIVEQMNGEITVESELGQGTTFIIILPIGKQV